MTSLVFYDDSFGSSIVVFNNSPPQLQVVFDIVHVDNIDAYIADMSNGTFVGTMSVQNPGGGALVNGSVYYVSPSSPPRFVTDVFNVNPPDQIGIVLLNFAYVNDTLIVSNEIFGGASLSITLQPVDIGTNGSGDVTLNPPSNQFIDANQTITTYPYSCFREGTFIATPAGYKLIETLQQGDLVYTGEKTAVEIVNMHANLVHGDDDLYRIPIGSITTFFPFTDLYISGGHAIVIDCEYHHVSCLTRRKHKVTPIHVSPCTVRYYHIELENKTNTIIANGVVCESYYDQMKGDVSWFCTMSCCQRTIKRQKIVKKKTSTYERRLYASFWNRELVNQKEINVQFVCKHRSVMNT